MPDGREIVQSSHAVSAHASPSTVRERSASAWTPSTIASRSSGSCGTRNGQVPSRPRNCFARSSSASSALSRACLLEYNFVERHVPVRVEDLETALLLLLELCLIGIQTFCDLGILRWPRHRRDVLVSNHDGKRPVGTAV